MKRWKQTASLVLALVLTAALLGGCGDHAKKAVIRTVLPDVTTLDPAMVTGESEMMIVSHLFENLMKFSGSGSQAKLIGGMARSYSEQDNADGSRIYTFALRSNVNWSDGSPVTAGDFVYAWRRLADPATGSPHAALLSMVAGYDAARSSGDMTQLKVTAKDDATLLVELSYPCAFFLPSVCTHPATMPVKESAVTPADQPIVGMPVTNGPYRISAWQGKVLTAVKNDDYYDVRLLLPDVLSFTFENDAAERRQLCESGEADLALEIGEGEGLMSEKSPEVTVLALNQMSSSMQEKTLRGALSAVIDRNALVEGDVFRAPACGLVPCGIRNSRGGDYRESSAALVDNDPAHFGELCAAAQEGLRAVAFNPENEPIFTLLYEDTPVLAAAALDIRDAWSEKIGLRPMLKAAASEELESALRSGEYTAALYTVRADCSDPSEFLDLWQAGQPGNCANYYSNAYNILIRSARNSSSAEARDAFLEAAEQLLAEEDGYVIPLWEARRSYFAAPTLQGTGYDCFGGLRLTAAFTAAEQ